MVKRFGMGVLLAGVLMLVAPAAARASVLIDFSNQGFGGTITQSGSDYVGSGITISSVLVNGAPVSGQWAVQNGTLDFNTATGAFSITGAISALGLASQTLLSGMMSSFSFTPFIGNTFAFVAQGSDTKSRAFLTALGLDPNMQFAFGGFSISGTSGTNGVYLPYSTDITNVPEPATLALFGLGLAAAARRRRLAA